MKKGTLFLGSYSMTIFVVAVVLFKSLYVIVALTVYVPGVVKNIGTDAHDLSKHSISSLVQKSHIIFVGVPSV